MFRVFGSIGLMFLAVGLSALGVVFIFLVVSWAWEAAFGSDPGVDHGQVHGAGAEMARAGPEQKGAGPHVEGGHGVGDVDQDGLRAALQQHGLEGRHVGRPGPEIRRQGDDRPGSYQYRFSCQGSASSW